jgi:nitrite reductase/ring-hydroxylating ferredoxin subunit
MSAPTTTKRRRLGAVEEFEEGVFRIVVDGTLSIGVIRTARGFFAVLNRCPHQGAPICSGRLTGTMLPSRPSEYRYSDERAVLVCPWHRWEFELETGRSVGAATRRRLPTFPIEVEDGQVYLARRRRA